MLGVRNEEGWWFAVGKWFRDPCGVLQRTRCFRDGCDGCANGRGVWGVEMTEFEGRVLADLSALKSQMDALLGVGQPGRLNALEERVQKHDQSMQRMKGMGGLLSLLLTAFHVAMDSVRR